MAEVEMGRAHGDCSSCVIAELFSQGQFSVKDQTDCFVCQSSGRTTTQDRIAQIDLTGVRLEIERQKSAAFFQKRVIGIAV